MRKNQEIFIFYNLLAFCALILGFSIAVYLVQNVAIDPYNIDSELWMLFAIVILIINYYYFGKKVQKIFEKSF